MYNNASEAIHASLNHLSHSHIHSIYKVSMRNTHLLRTRNSFILAAIVLFAASSFAFGQAAAPAESGGSSMFTILILAAGAGILGFLIYLKVKEKKEAAQVVVVAPQPRRTRPAPVKCEVKPPVETVEKAETAPVEDRPAPDPKANLVRDIVSGEASEAKAQLRRKMQNLKYINLPISSFSEVRASRPFEDLPSSDDRELNEAIDTLLDEFEESEEKRGQAMRVIAANRSKNSVDALTQAAFYDVSANLRSRAVTILTDFDHESCFEPILLACADPGREVRAAAARGLFKLSCDRANAWTRILESNDEFRIKNAVRAAEEANIVRNTFDRLIHADIKMSYEAFVLSALIVRSGETELLFFALKNHADPNVRRAILHVLDIAGDERVVEPISNVLSQQLLTADLAEKAGGVMRKFENVLLETF